MSTETMTSPTDWTQQYYRPNNNYNNLSAAAGEPPKVSDSTVVTTTTTFMMTSTTTPRVGAGNLSPDGRVSKPIRRRSRASRRTPTTLLNTDASNFRAMVQQFTGGPNINAPPPVLPAAGFQHLPSGANFSFVDPFQFQAAQLRQQYMNNFDHSVPTNNTFLRRLDGSRTTSVNERNDADTDADDHHNITNSNNML